MTGELGDAGDSGLHCEVGQRAGQDSPKPKKHNTAQGRPGRQPG